MAKLNIPAGIAKAIAEGKTVIWAQKGAYDHKKGCNKILPRINDKPAKFYQVEAVIENATKAFWQPTILAYLGDKEIGVIPTEDIYIDAVICESGYYPLRYERGKKFHWFRGDIDCPVEAYGAHEQYSGGYYKMCAFAE